MIANILVVDDEKVVRRILVQTLTDAGYDVEEAGSVDEAKKSLEQSLPDLVLLDYKLPDGTGLDVLKQLRKASPTLPAVMITAHGSIPGAVQAVKEGAYDYISKPFEEDELLQTVQRALETSRLRSQVARHQDEASATYGSKNIVANSTAMHNVLTVLKKVAESGASTILLLGESGVGKGLIARAIHLEAAGSNEKSFMNVTCTALPEALLESELFGHEKGAFTDARTEKKGLFELANGGTVFLDEIGDIPQSLQGKLLRFLEEKTFRRVGGTRDIQVNVRVIAATNKNLEKEVQAGRFRSDLFFRLNVITIEIPPLRNRREDLVPLMDNFIRHFNREFNKGIKGVTDEVRDCLLKYSWPGNVRELRNAIERAVLLSESDQLTLNHFPESVHRNVEIQNLSGEGGATAATAQGNFQLPDRGLILEDLEKNLVIQALKRSGGNHVEAAKLLGMNRHQIRYRIEKFRIEI